ncbi:MAG: hypothetical protein NT124_04335 [Candidatus Dependentiae bacterium]|nr:hypothetical protein [Candidatus Dependentiae bacterium]
MFGIVENGICVDIGQLKKILIEDWSKLYKTSYEYGESGEDFYTFILGEIADCADAFSYKMEDMEAKRLGVPGARIAWQDYYPKSDVRSIGFEVLNFLEGVCAGPIERLTTDDISVILEFLDTPPDKSLEAWDKWEKYWDSLDYPERRRKLLDEFEALKEAAKIGKTFLNTERHGGMKEAQEVLDKTKKEFISRELRSEGVMTIYGVRILYCYYKDRSRIQLKSEGDLGHSVVVEIVDIKNDIIETITFKE